MNSFNVPYPSIYYPFLTVTASFNGQIGRIKSAPPYLFKMYWYSQHASEEIGRHTPHARLSTKAIVPPRFPRIDYMDEGLQLVPRSGTRRVCNSQRRCPSVLPKPLLQLVLRSRRDGRSLKSLEPGGGRLWVTGGARRRRRTERLYCDQFSNGSVVEARRTDAFGQKEAPPAIHGWRHRFTCFAMSQCRCLPSAKISLSL